MRWYQRELNEVANKAKNVWLIAGSCPRKLDGEMLLSRSGILAEKINTMEMPWVAFDQVVSGSCDAVVIRRVVISRHTKVKNFSRTLAGTKQDSATRHHHPTTIKALHSKKIIKLGFLSLPYWLLTESSQYQSWKAKLFPALSGNNLGLSEFKIYGPPIMPLKHKNKGILKHYIPNIKNAV